MPLPIRPRRIVKPQPLGKKKRVMTAREKLQRFGHMKEAVLSELKASTYVNAGNRALNKFQSHNTQRALKQYSLVRQLGGKAEPLAPSPAETRHEKGVRNALALLLRKVRKEGVEKAPTKGPSLVKKLLRGKFEDPKKPTDPPNVAKGGQTVPVGVFAEKVMSRWEYLDAATKSLKSPDNKKAEKRIRGRNNAMGSLWRHARASVAAKKPVKEETVAEMLDLLDIKLSEEQIAVLSELSNKNKLNGTKKVVEKETKLAS